MRRACEFSGATIFTPAGTRLLPGVEIARDGAGALAASLASLGWAATGWAGFAIVLTARVPLAAGAATGRLARWARVSLAKLGCIDMPMINDMLKVTIAKR